MLEFHQIRYVSKFALLGLAFFFLAACSALPGSAPTQYYILKTVDGVSTGGSQITIPEGVNVGIGPIQIPGYADRPQIVTFDSGAEIIVSDFDHWAEPLNDAIKRVVTANVATLIGEEKVFSYPADFRPDKQSLQVAVNVIDITETGAGIARFVVRWHVKELYDNNVLTRHAKTYETQAVVGDYNSYANALSQLLGEFSHDITISINELPSSR